MLSLDLKGELILYQIEQGLQRAAELIKKICGGKVSKFDIQKIENVKNKTVKFDT